MAERNRAHQQKSELTTMSLLSRPTVSANTLNKIARGRQEPYKHMSVIVVLNSVEMLVDLMRFPGQLLPRSTKAVFMTHISAGESDSAENDSCDSPLEPNSPLFGVSERLDPNRFRNCHYFCFDLITLLSPMLY